MHLMQREPAWLREGSVLIACLALAACSTVEVPPTASSTEVVLAAPVDQVRSTVLTVLTQEGYSFDLSEEPQQGEIVETDYKRELPIWNSLIISRFGTTRNRMIIMLAKEGETDTRLNVYVEAEGKSGDYVPLFSGWTPYDPPVRHSPENFVQLVKNSLGLL